MSQPWDRMMSYIYRSADRIAWMESGEIKTEATTIAANPRYKLKGTWTVEFDEPPERSPEFIQQFEVHETLGTNLGTLEYSHHNAINTGDEEKDIGSQWDIK